MIVFGYIKKYINQNIKNPPSEPGGLRWRIDHYFGLMQGLFKDIGRSALTTRHGIEWECTQ